MQITVVGHAQASLPPERATLSLQVGHEGGDKAQVLVRTTHLTTQLSAALDHLAAQRPAPTTWSAVLPIATSSWRPSSKDGHVLPMRYAARCEVKVKFRDFSALSAFIDQWGQVEGVRVQYVEWTLTEKRSVEQTEAVLARAVEEARRRATTIAQAAGAGAVRFVEVADQGMLSTGGAEHTAYASHALRAGAGPGGEGVELRPEDVEVDVTVHARFTTD